MVSYDIDGAEACWRQIGTDFKERSMDLFIWCRSFWLFVSRFVEIYFSHIYICNLLTAKAFIWALRVYMKLSEGVLESEEGFPRQRKRWGTMYVSLPRTFDLWRWRWSVVGRSVAQSVGRVLSCSNLGSSENILSSQRGLVWRSRVFAFVSQSSDLWFRVCVWQQQLWSDNWTTAGC